MTDEAVYKISDEEITETAKKYYNARLAKDKSSQRHYFFELYKIAVTCSSPLSRKLRARVLQEEKFKNDADQLISEYFFEIIKYYAPEKNPNFSAFMLKFINQYMMKKSMKLGTVFSLDEMLGGDDDAIDESKLAKVGTDEPFKDSESVMMMRTHLPTLITNFYKHLSTKSATKERYHYFRIFNTEYIAQMIYESGNTFYFNKTEAYESTDKGFVEYIASSDYQKLDDLIKIKFRLMSDVIGDYTGSAEKISFPIDQRIVAEYWVRSGIGEKKPTVANVSDFKKKYLEYCRKFL